MSTDRRKFLKSSMAAAAAVAVRPVAGTAAQRSSSPPDGPIIDTNVDLCCWPYRHLKYGSTTALADKLKEHGVRQAWTGSYDAMFHKNLDAVNRRTAEECRSRGQGVLVPFGAVNPAWPDWREDLRRCDEAYGMPGIKLLPTFHGYQMNDPSFVELLRRATDRDMLVQIVCEMEDPRMLHPRVQTVTVDMSPLPAVLDEVPDAKVMLINNLRRVRKYSLEAMVNETDVFFEISNLDGVGGIERILRGDHPYMPGAIAVDRLLFGSHVPFFPLESALFKFVESDLTAAQETAIMDGNAEKLISV